MISDFDGSVLKYYKNETTNSEKKENTSEDNKSLVIITIMLLNIDTEDIKNADEVNSDRQ